MDAYRKGLTGAQAVWANRKYHGHRTLPPEAINSIDSDQLFFTIYYDFLGSQLAILRH